MNFVFRNSMLEIFFPKEKYLLSNYDSPLSEVDADNFLWMNFLKPSPSLEDISQQIEELENNLNIAIKSAKTKPIYILGLFMPKLFISQVASENNVTDQIYNFNKKVINISNEFNNINYLDPDYFLNIIGNNYFSSKFYFSSSSIISPLCISSFKVWLNNIETTIYKKKKKLLILDLDNTLWGGVIGEDGYNGIQIDNSYPGNAYLYIQKKIKELSSQGIILAICSKNNIDDVKEAFEMNNNMHLKIDDFSLIKANWEEKSLNIKNIISEINVGEDACVFIDDNPLERDMVKNSFPNLVVPEFPLKQYDIPQFIDTVSFKYFSSKKLINEDRDKKIQYQIKIQAQNDRLNSSSKDEFLKNLGLEGIIYSDLEPHISRISQMTQKTNQFNLTTKRHDENEIKTIIESGNYVFPLQVKDKYGDHGITALIITEQTSKPDEVDITNFLMSCRILGREIEYEFLKWCLSFLHSKGVKLVTARYIATKKNNQVVDLYENAGLELTKETNSEKAYKADLREWLNTNTIKEKYINIKEA